LPRKGLNIACLRHAALVCACFVSEPGQNIQLPLSKKKKADLEIVGFSMFGSGPLWS
jgi:hypothetical protein